MSNKLTPLDFGGGIRAEVIEHNFKTLDEQVKRERARMGGYGIVEGFDIEIISSTQLKIRSGVIVNKQGEEVIVPERIVSISDPDFAEHKLIDLEDALTVNNQGELELPYVPYSDKKKGFFDNNYYQSNYPDVQEELLICDAYNPDLKIRALRVEGKIVTLDANIWSNKKVFTEYLHTKNRMDTILIDAKGQIKIEHGVLTTSPSHVDLERYDGFFVLAIVEVIVGKEVGLKVYQDLRTYRKVYVDKNNQLYINGKLYKESQIVHFEEPEEPYLNALWYDGATNKLMIWKDIDGTIGWVAVNEETHMPIKQVKIFSPDEFPEDSQTFLFGEEETNCYFIPEHNQLEIIIDNAPLMSDQYEEVIDPEAGDYTNSGIGFKLKDPLDKEAYVEVRILHTVNSFPIRRTFQRTATFVNDSFAFHDSLNTGKVFETEVPYVIGERQLDVYVDGNRLVRSLDYEEILTPNESASDLNNGKSSKVFKVLKDITPGQVVSYRIAKNVYSYDHLDGWVDEIEEKANQALADLEEVRSDISTMDKNIQDKFKTIDDNIVDIVQKLGGQNNYLKKDDVLQKNNMPKDVLGGLANRSVYLTRPAESTTTIEDMKETDFLLVFYVSATQNRVLLKDIDFVIQQAGDSLLLVLDSQLVDSSSSIYITGIKFGI